MATFATIAKNVEDIDFDKELQNIFSSKTVMDFIVRGVWADIYENGKVGKEQIKLSTDRSFGGVYSGYTQEVKRKKGQKISNVTLEDTGKLRLSTNLKAFPTFAELTANFEKENGSVYENFTDLFSNKTEFENEVLTLSPKRYKELINEYIIDELKEIIIKKITNV